MNRTLLFVAVTAIILTCLICAIFFMLARNIISYDVALLMLIALFGMYLGFGVLIAVYRLVSKLK